MTKRILNPEQLEAVEHDKGPLLIIAGAGTGKTTVITERLNYLISQKKINPSQILALTFTEKAANEMEIRSDMILPYGYNQLSIDTFHAFSDRVLRDDGLNIGISPNFKVMMESEALMFMRKNLHLFQFNYFNPLGNPTRLLKEFLAYFSRLRDDDITPADYLKYSKNLNKTNSNKEDQELEIQKHLELADIFIKYSQLKEQGSLLDFSDLVPSVLRLFRERKNILKIYRDRFKYILVDEFQDTNYAQNELALLIAGNEEKNITVVGDDDQSIYRFRGASISNMVDFKVRFPNAKIITLNKNYRSTQAILDQAYELIQFNNPDRLEIKERINKKLISQIDKPQIENQLIYATSAEEEAERVVKEIIKLIKEEDYKLKDFAILVRANDHSLAFQKTLQRFKVPFQFLGPDRLFHQEEIKDLIAYLKILTNFDDDTSLYRILTLSIFDLNSRDIASIIVYSKKNNLSLFESIERVDEINVSEDSNIKINKIKNLIHKHLDLLTKNTADQILYDFFEESGLLGYYLDPATKLTEIQAENVALFFEKISKLNSNKESSIFEVLEWIDMAMELGESPLASESDWSNNNAVNILTVHSSKGLEFPVVFVANLVSLRFPSRDRKEKIVIPQELIHEKLPSGDEHLQEERRLFYVACTRAKDRLYISAASNYNQSKRQRKISPFVYELMGKEYVDKTIKKTVQEISATQLSLLNSIKPLTTSDTVVKEDQSKKEIDIDFISYSQIQTFELCPLHYKLRYIMKLPVAPQPHVSFGTTIHALLNVLYKMDFHKNKISESTISDLIEKYWIYSGFSDKYQLNSYKKKAFNLVANYIKENMNEISVPKLTEYDFNFFIDNVKVIGRFDRVDMFDDGRIEIIDYKTGDNVPDEKSLNKNFQLSLYGLAAKQFIDPLFNRSLDQILLTLFYVEKNIRLTTTRSEDQLEETTNYIKEKINQIKTSSFQCSKSMLCKNCEYKMLCNTNH